MTAAANRPPSILRRGDPFVTVDVDRELSGMRSPYRGSGPVVLMSAPFSLSANEPNNPWMAELSEAERVVDLDKAYLEFMELYRAVSSEALVYLLPTTPGLQDQVYVSNLVVVPAHRPDTAVIANFASPPRRGESMPGRSFLTELGYDIVQAPKYFEGEADLKHLRDNVYIGACGRTTLDALGWFASELDAQVIPFVLKNPRLYHLDCVVMPISADACVVCVDECDRSTLETIEKFVEVIPVDHELATWGVTNSICVGGKIICGSSRAHRSPDDPDLVPESRMVAFLESLCSRLGRELVEVPLGEITKSGAALSCLVAHLRRA